MVVIAGLRCVVYSVCVSKISMRKELRGFIWQGARSSSGFWTVYAPAVEDLWASECLLSTQVGVGLWGSWFQRCGAVQLWRRPQSLWASVSSSVKQAQSSPQRSCGASHAKDVKCLEQRVARGDCSERDSCCVAVGHRKGF